MPTRLLAATVAILALIGAALTATTADGYYRPAPTTTTVALDPIVQYQQCRENGPGRVAATRHLWDYKTTWAQPEADAIVGDVDLFIRYCTGYAGAGGVVKTGKVAKACLLEWSGWLPQQGACYNPPGNEINPYTSALLVSSR